MTRQRDSSRLGVPSLLVAASLAGACLPPPPPMAIVGPIVVARDIDREYVQVIKQRWKPADKAYQRARLLYGEVYARYDAWITHLAFAIPATGASPSLEGSRSRAPRIRSGGRLHRP